MDSELLLKFIGHFPDYLLALSRTLLRLVWTTFVETAVYYSSKRIVINTGKIEISLTSMGFSDIGNLFQVKTEPE